MRESQTRQSVPQGGATAYGVPQAASFQDDNNHSAPDPLLPPHSPHLLENRGGAELSSFKEPVSENANVLLLLHINAIAALRCTDRSNKHATGEQLTQVNGALGAEFCFNNNKGKGSKRAKPGRS